MGFLAVIGAVVAATVEAWLTEDIPRPGLPPEENMKRIKNLVISVLSGYAFGYMYELARR